MADKTPLGLEHARALARAWGIELGSVAPFEGGSVNSNFCLTAREGRRYFLRVYEEQAESGAACELALVSALARAGVPTPAPLPRQDGGLLGEHAGKPVAVFPWIEGTIVCQAAVKPEHCERVGRALARVHASGVEVQSVGRFTPDALYERLGVIERHAEFAADARSIRARLGATLERREPELPRGAIHGDLFRDNVLWQGGEIAALVDFESASRGVFVYDLAVTIEAWCFSSRFERELVQAMLRGYDAVRPLSASERAALPVEAALGALRFATTRILDYSFRAPPGRPPLRDYRRFLARLDAIEAGALDGL